MRADVYWAGRLTLCGGQDDLERYERVFAACFGHGQPAVIWANPPKARPGYAPPAAGMAAASPSVDSFVEGHSLAALERLAAVVRGAGTGPVEGADRA